MSFDEDLRALERAAASDPRAAVAYARALERAGRTDEATTALLAALDEPEAREHLERVPAWETSGGTWGRTEWIDVLPLTAPPKIRWRTKSVGAVLASAIAVVVDRPDGDAINGRVAVLDPRTGETRFELRGYAAGLAGPLVLVESPDSTLLRAHDPFTGDLGWEVAIDTDEEVAVDGDLLVRWNRGVLRRARFDARSLREVDTLSPSVPLWHPASLLAHAGVVAVCGPSRAAIVTNGRAVAFDLDGAKVIAMDDRHLLTAEFDWIALHAHDGTLLWELRRDSDATWSYLAAAALAPRFALARSVGREEKLVVIDRVAGTPRGELVIEHGFAAPVVAREVVYVSGYHEVSAIGIDGTLRWRWSATPRVRVRRLVPTWGGLLVATTEELIALGP